MTAESTLRVSSSAELIATLPYLIGFHPADSIVVLGVRGLKIAFAARHDLPEPGVPGAVVRGEAARMAALVAGQGVTATAVIGYGAEALVTPTVLRLTEALERAGLPVIEQLRVADGRYWSFHCLDRGCCPATGRECLPPHSSIAAAATYSGAVALPDRETLVAQLSPVADPAPSGPALARLEESFARGSHEAGGARHLRKAGREAVREAERRYRSGGRLTDEEVAWLGALLAYLPVRDYAWERTGEEDWWTVLWTDILRRVESSYVPAPACLLAFAAWRAGNGSLARVAVERAVAHDPDYPMAALIDEMLRLALHPRVLTGWPQVGRPWRFGLPEPGSALENGRLGRDSRQRRGRAI
jgi:hypothetical protein